MAQVTRSDRRMAVLLCMAFGAAFLADKHFAHPQVAEAFIGTALAIGLGVASAVGSVAGGVLQKKAADNQAKLAKSAADQSVAENKRQFDITQGNLKPYITRGNNAGEYLNYLLGIPGAIPGWSPSNPQGSGAAPASATGDTSGGYTGGGNTLRTIGHVYDDNGRGRMIDGEVFHQPHVVPRGSMTLSNVGQFNPQNDANYGSLLKPFTMADFTKGPDYDFLLNEGQRAIQRSAAARGSVLGGGTLKALLKYGQDYGSTKYGEAYNRNALDKTRTYNFLAGVSGSGQQEANTLANIGQNYAANNANIVQNSAAEIGNARASGYAGIGNAINGGINGIMQSYLLKNVFGKP